MDVYDAVTGGSWKGLFPPDVLHWAESGAAAAGAPSGSDELNGHDGGGLDSKFAAISVAIVAAHLIVVNVLFGAFHLAFYHAGLGKLLWRFKYIKSWPKDSIVAKEVRFVSFYSGSSLSPQLLSSSLSLSVCVSPSP